MSVCTGIYLLKFVTIRGILEVLVFPSVAKNTAQSKSPTLTLDVLLGVSLCIPDVLETCYLVTVEVWMRIPLHPKAHVFEYLVSNWWHYLGRLRRCGGLLEEVCHWEQALRVKDFSHPSLPSRLASCLRFRMWALGLLLPSDMPPPWCDGSSHSGAEGSAAQINPSSANRLGHGVLPQQKKVRQGLWDHFLKDNQCS